MLTGGLGKDTKPTKAVQLQASAEADGDTSTSGIVLKRLSETFPTQTGPMHSCVTSLPRLYTTVRSANER